MAFLGATCDKGGSRCGFMRLMPKARRQTTAAGATVTSVGELDVGSRTYKRMIRVTACCLSDAKHLTRQLHAYGEHYGILFCPFVHGPQASSQYRRSKLRVDP